MVQSGPILRHRTQKTVSEKVSELLRKSGLGYNEVERRTDGRITHSYLSKLISGASANPRLDKLVELADLFKVSVSELVGDEETEPKGFRESEFWELFEAYDSLEKAFHRKMVDEYLRGLDEMMRAWPKKTKESAEGPRHPRAEGLLRKSR